MASKSHISSYLPIEDVAIPVDDDAHYFPFDHHLASTKLVYPEGWDNHTVTDYGLYTSANLCATLRKGEGKYGGAIAVEEGTVNLLDPNRRSPESGTKSGWSTSIGNLSYAVSDYDITTDDPIYGNYCIYATTSGTRTEGIGQTNISGEKGKTYTLSVYAKAPVGVNLSLKIRSDEGSTISSTFSYTGSGKWERIHVTITALLDTDPVFRWGLQTSEATTFYVDAVQFEEKSFPTSFVDGSRGSGRFYISEKTWNPAQGTFACWAKSPIAGSASDRHLILQWAKGDSSTTSRFGLAMRTNGRMGFTFGASGFPVFAPQSSDDGEWHHYASTWINGTNDIHLYVDGKKVASESVVRTISNPGGRVSGIIPIGHRGFSYHDQWWNGLIDELLILPYVATEEQISAIYHTQRPLYDPNRIDHIVG